MSILLDAFEAARAVAADERLHVIHDGVDRRPDVSNLIIGRGLDLTLWQTAESAAEVVDGVHKFAFVPPAQQVGRAAHPRGAKMSR